MVTKGPPRIEVHKKKRRKEEPGRKRQHPLKRSNRAQQEGLSCGNRDWPWVMTAPKAPNLRPAVHPKRVPPVNVHRAAFVHAPDSKIMNPSVQSCDDVLQGFYVSIIHVTWPSQTAMWEPRLVFRISAEVDPSIETVTLNDVQAAVHWQVRV